MIVLSIKCWIACKIIIIINNKIKITSPVVSAFVTMHVYTTTRSSKYCYQSIAEYDINHTLEYQVA